MIDERRQRIAAVYPRMPPELHTHGWLSVYRTTRRTRETLALASLPSTSMPERKDTRKRQTGDTGGQQETQTPGRSSLPGVCC